MKGAREKIQDTVSVSERLAEVQNRATPSHWEDDLLSGSHIATLVERQTRYVMLAKASNKQMQEVTGALKRVIGKLPTELRRSPTLDRGKELGPFAPLSAFRRLSTSSVFCAGSVM